LRGITWDHPRGLASLRATAAAFERAHGDVRLTWTARSLQAFGDQPIEELATAYDLLLIDHPFVGVAARSGCLVPLEAHLPPVFLAAQAEQSVGPSHHSYTYGGHQWALAIDAAAQVSAYRPDLLDKLAMAVPRTWDEVLALAPRQTGAARVAIPLSPVNAICSFLTLCASHGEPPGAAATHLVSRHGAHSPRAAAPPRRACPSEVAAPRSAAHP
jgi:multiple sugar transport system substrate-binding protein